ncbi:MAG TPA: hypothetical protein VM327_08795 [Candidatus Thermoplasmatota archaeon]|nr:hypothetical protein [Candidatus Thermoplasmatota archaeon]
MHDPSTTKESRRAVLQAFHQELAKAEQHVNDLLHLHAKPGFPSAPNPIHPSTS